MRSLDRLIDGWNVAALPVEQRLYEAVCLIEKLQEERLTLQRRIHNQRMSNRLTWEAVEQRRKWLGSDTARKRAIFWRDQYHKLRAKLCIGEVGK